MNLQTRLTALAKNKGWRICRTGLYPNGLYFLEYETREQYDEWQFESKGSLADFLEYLDT